MSYIPPNIILPNNSKEINLNKEQKASINSEIKSIDNNKEIIIENEKNKNYIKNSNINNLSENKIIEITEKNNKKKNKNKDKPNEFIFKKEDINKPIKNYSDEEIMHYVHLIFLNNSLYYPKKQQYLMAHENLLKIMRKIGLIPNEIKLYELDILIKKICPKTKLLTYDDFMELLIEIGHKLFPKEFKKDKSLVTNFLFHNIFLSFNEIIFDESIPLKDLLKYQYSSLASLLNIIPEDSQILVINSLLYTLNEIYEKYFIYNIGLYSNNKDYYYENGNLNSLFNFCRDFEIAPYIFSETQVVTYYNLVVDNNELFKFIDDTNENKDNNSGYFTFNNFILFFIHLSSYHYAKVYGSILGKEKNDNELSKLIMLLSKLECSKGMRNLIDNTLPNISLIPNRELFYKYNFEYQQENELKKDNNNKKYIDKNNDNNYNNVIYNDNNININNNINNNNNENKINIIEENNNNLINNREENHNNENDI